jgi:hypothetical protein
LLDEELELELDLSELDDEVDDFSVDVDFSAGLSDDFSDGLSEDDEDSPLPLEPLIVLFEASRLSLR